MNESHYPPSEIGAPPDGPVAGVDYDVRPFITTNYDSGWHPEPRDNGPDGPDEFAKYAALDEELCSECWAPVGLYTDSRRAPNGHTEEFARWAYFWVDSSGVPYCEDCAEGLR